MFNAADMQREQSKKNDWLSAYKKNVTSQYGEDGIIEKIFEVIPASTHKWCVEVGAWDGVDCSNIWNLITTKNWSAVLIESDPKKYLKLLKTHQKSQGVICLNKKVSFEGLNTLDNLLLSTPLPKDFDLLSIDIDGNDFFIWESVVKYEPKVVVIEFNPSIPTDVEFVQPKDMNVNQGSSLFSLYKLAKRKEYELVATTSCNAFFVRRTYYDLFNIRDNLPSSIHKDRESETKIFQLFDGTLVLTGCRYLLWHNVEIKQSAIQILPRFLRRYPPILSPILTRLFIEDWSIIFIFPIRLLKKVVKKCLKAVLACLGIYKVGKRRED